MAHSACHITMMLTVQMLLSLDYLVENIDTAKLLIDTTDAS